MSKKRGPVMRARWMLGLPVALGLALTSVAEFSAFSAPSEAPESFFPHEFHAGLFPVCLACHGGVTEGAALYTVAATDCANCHNDDLLDAIEWETPGQSSDPSWFEHQLHIGDAGLACADCHRPTGADERMDVVPATVDRCADCHDVEDHATDELDCASCHGS